jgi:hypothetical protein
MGWWTVRKLPLALACALALPLMAPAADKPSVRIEPANLHGSRTLEDQTEKSVVRDYLESWDTLVKALDQNQPDLLAAYFTGTALEALTGTVTEQTRLGIHTRYVPRSHDLQIIFYSPEGLSIQLTDTVQYDELIMDHDKVLADKPIERRYLVVMTPSQVRWRVRIFQAEEGPAKT